MDRDEAEALARQHGEPSGDGGDEPILWVGAPTGDAVAVLALAPASVVHALLPQAELGNLAEYGPAVLEAYRPDVVPVEALDRVLSAEEARLRVERRDGGGSITMDFATPGERDAAFSTLHRLLAPQAPLTQLRRPARHFLELAGGSLLLLAFGLGLPWMVESGQISETHWLVATVFNALGATGFRILGVVLAAACLAGLVVIAINNPVRTGFRIRITPPR